MMLSACICLSLSVQTSLNVVLCRDHPLIRKRTGLNEAVINVLLILVCAHFEKCSYFKPSTERDSVTVYIFR